MQGELSQKQLAQLPHVCTQTILHWEKNQTKKNISKNTTQIVEFLQYCPLA